MVRILSMVCGVLTLGWDHYYCDGPLGAGGLLLSSMAPHCTDQRPVNSWVKPCQRCLYSHSIDSKDIWEREEIVVCLQESHRNSPISCYVLSRPRSWHYCVAFSDCVSPTELPSAPGVPWPLAMTHTSVPRSLQARCMSRKLTSADVISIVSLYIKLVPLSIMTQWVIISRYNIW